MSYHFIGWIESAKNGKRIHSKKIKEIESKANLNSVIVLAERTGLQPILSETHLILIRGKRLTLQLSDTRTLVVHQGEAVIRTQASTQDPVTQIPSSAPRKLP